MDGSRSAGNPSAKSSRSLPAHTLPAEEDQQSRESVSLSGTQKHQRPGEKCQSPAESHQSLGENQQGPVEKDQSQRGIQRTEEKPEQPDLTETTNHSDPLTDKLKPAPRLNKSFATKPIQLKPDPFRAEQQKQGNCSLTEKQKTVINQLKPEHLISSKHQPTADQPTQTSPAKLDQTKLDPVPAEQQNPGEPSVTEKLKTKGSLFPKDQPKPDQASQTKPDQKKPKHKQQPHCSQEHQTQKGPCLTNQRTEEDPVHTSIQSQTEQNKLDPPPEKCTVTTPERHQDHQDPPPHLNSQLTSPITPPPLTLIIHPSTLAPPAPPLTIEAFCGQVWPCPPGSSSGEPKLCGFLQKQGGPLKAWKQRWFTYEEKKNQLFYYRTPQDVMPLGQVELTGATFTYPLRAERGTFHIKTPERTFILKVDVYLTMFKSHLVWV